MAQPLNQTGQERGGNSGRVPGQIDQREAASGQSLTQFDQDAEGEGRECEVGPSAVGGNGEEPDRDRIEGHGMGDGVAEAQMPLQALERTQQQTREQDTCCESSETQKGNQTFGGEQGGDPGEPTP